MKIRAVPIALFAVLWMTAAGAQPSDPEATAQAIGPAAQPLTDEASLSPLIERAARTRLVLLGEASHGTSEYYTWRAAISRRLIETGRFSFIAVEGDWASIYELNRYVKHLDNSGAAAREIMAGFTRWPTWMWANEETAELVEWLRAHNASLPLDERVGLYGMDVYGPWQSIREAQELLRETAYRRQASNAFACLAGHEEDPGEFLRNAAQRGETCEDRIDSLLEDLRNDAALRAELGDRNWFKLEQHILVVRNAKAHYLAMRERGPDSWNRRVEHFKLTAARLLEYHGPDARGIAWAHNTHVGDARATSMAATGQQNIGQMARERYGEEEVFIIGFGTYQGQVLAGAAWAAPMQVMDVPRAANGSFEDLLNHVGKDAFFLLMDDPRLRGALREVWGHRAIGVVYDPAREVPGNYVPTIPADRYDAFVFIRKTQALRWIE